MFVVMVCVSGPKRFLKKSESTEYIKNEELNNAISERVYILQFSVEMY